VVGAETMETSAFTVCGVSVSRVCEAPDEQGLVHGEVTRPFNPASSQSTPGHYVLVVIV
jgi:hypothetical protein